MRRSLVSCLGAGLVAMALGASGCGGGIEQGVPKDTTLQPPPSSIQTHMGPPPKKMPTAGHTSFRLGPASIATVRGHA